MNISNHTQTALEGLAIAALWPTYYAINHFFAGGILDLASKMVKSRSPEQSLIELCKENAFINLNDHQRAELDALANRLGFTRRIELARINKKSQDFWFDSSHKDKDENLLEVLGTPWPKRFPAIIKVNSDSILNDLKSSNLSSANTTGLLSRIARFKERSSEDYRQNCFIGICVHVASIASGYFAGKKTEHVFGSYSPFMGIGAGYLAGVFASNAFLGLKTLQMKRRVEEIAARASTIEELALYMQTLRMKPSNKVHYLKLLVTPYQLWDDSTFAKLRKLDSIRKEKIYRNKNSEVGSPTGSLREPASPVTQEIKSTTTQSDQIANFRGLRPEIIEMRKAYRTAHGEFVLNRIRGVKKTI